MPDPYLAIADIAADQYMNARMRACVTQQAFQEVIPLDVEEAPVWVAQNAYVWAASPSWGEKWKYSLDSHTGEDPPYEPGKDDAVITDADILSTVQALIPSQGQREQAEAEAPQDQREQDTAQSVSEENTTAPTR